MKKKVCCGSIALFVVTILSVTWMCFAPDADSASRPELLTPKDVSALKGKWVGRTHFENIESGETGGAEATELEIYNDTLPLEGKISFLVLPRRVWVELPMGIQGGPTGQGAVVPFKKGKLSNKGAFTLISGENSLVLFLYNEKGKQQLVGTIFMGTTTGPGFVHGDVTLHKK